MNAVMLLRSGRPGPRGQEEAGVIGLVDGVGDLDVFWMRFWVFARDGEEFVKVERFGADVDGSEKGRVGATMTRYFVWESFDRPRGINVCGVYGCLSSILTSNTFSPPFCCRSFRGEETNIFITGFASFFEGARG